jgi:segregation and condensation protein B
MSSEPPKTDRSAAEPGGPESSLPPSGNGPLEQSAAGEEAALPALAYEELCGGLEALLYASPEPLSVRDLKKAFPEAEPEVVVRALKDLVGAYQVQARGLQLIEVAGGYQITSRPEYHDRIARLLEEKKPSRLTPQALETLAVIAYRQPITVPEIIALRGVRSAGVVRTLLEKKLIRITGRKRVVGRPLLYGTTREFLSRFGLKDLSELPRKEDIAEIFGEGVEGAGVLDDLPPSAPPSSEGGEGAEGLSESADSRPSNSSREPAAEEEDGGPQKQAR